MKNLKVSLNIEQVRWIFSILFGLLALSSLFSSFLSFLAGSLFAFLLSPYSDKVLEEKFSDKISFGNKITIMVVLFFSFFILKNLYGSSEKNNQLTTNEVPNLSNVEEVKTSSEFSETLTISKDEDLTGDINLYKVVRIVDGDTIVVSSNNVEYTVRLIGVDTPELSNFGKPAECFGVDASNYLYYLINDQNVLLEPDSTQADKDVYNRLLRYVYLSDSVSVNEKIIRDGYGYEYTYNNPYKNQSAHKEAENYASSNNLGLWSVCNVTSSESKPVIPIVPLLDITDSNDSEDVVENNASSNAGNNQNNESSFTCSCSKTCDQMASCDEAYYQLNTCGCSKRDSDKDGIPCESICK